MADIYTVLNLDPDFDNVGYIDYIGEFTLIAGGTYGDLSDSGYTITPTISGYYYIFTGSNFEYDQNGQPVSGFIDKFTFYKADGTPLTEYSFNGAAVDQAIVKAALDAYVVSQDIVEFQGLAVSAELIGAASNDRLIGRLNVQETMTGGDGSDEYYVDDATDIIIETNSDLLTGGTDTVFFRGSTGTFILGNNVENLLLDGETNSSLINGTGNSLDNTLLGNSAVNTLSGLGGKDTINGGDGADTLIGGNGNDTYYANTKSDKVIETNTSVTTGGYDTVIYEGTSTFTLGANVEKLVMGGTAAINGKGNSLANRLIGNDAANTLSGLGGKDSIDGGKAADTMIGGDGDDTYYANSAADIVTETNISLTTGGKDKVFYSGASTFTLGTNVENLTLTGTSTSKGTGNASANTLLGNSSANTLSGLGGKDSLDGGKGSDTLIGGNGDDTYFANVTTDKIIETAANPTSGGIDLVNYTGSAGTFKLATYVENLTLRGIGDTGGTGNSSRNTILGNSGSNEINGKQGNDTLTGGKGQDSFIFNNALSATSNVDKITDYNVTNDTIILESEIFDGLGSVGDTMLASRFKNIGIAGTTVDSNDRIIYNDDTGKLYYDSDGSGSDAAILFAQLTTKPNINYEDFFVV